MLEPIINTPYAGYSDIPVDQNTISYLGFMNPEAPDGTIYDYVNKEALATTITRSTQNSILEDTLVGYLPGDRSFPFTTSQALDGDFTMEVWCRSEASVPSGGAMIVISNMSGAGTNSNRISLGIIANDLLISPTAYGTNRNTNEVIAPFSWHHLCFMRKNGVAYIFHNGVLVNTFTYTPVISTLTYRLGSYIAGTMRYFNGRISDAAISKVARYNQDGFTPIFPIPRGW